MNSFLFDFNNSADGQKEMNPTTNRHIDQVHGVTMNAAQDGAANAKIETEFDSIIKLICSSVTALNILPKYVQKQ